MRENDKEKVDRQRWGGVVGRICKGERKGWGEGWAGLGRSDQSKYITAVYERQQKTRAPDENL